MLAEERRRKILELTQRDGRVGGAGSGTGVDLLGLGDPSGPERGLVDVPVDCDDPAVALELVGHDHHRALVWLEGPKTKIPAVGVPSASARAPHGDENSAGYNVFHIDGEAGNWRCEMVGRERDAEGGFRDAERRTLY